MASGSLREFFNSITDPLTLCDRHGRIAAANEAFLSMVGRPATEVLNAHCYGVLHARAGRCDDCPLEKLFRTGSPVSREVATTLPDGTRSCWQVHSYPVFDSSGAPVQALQLGHEITARKNREDRAAAVAELHRNFIQKAPGSLFLLGSDGTVTLANERLAETLGYFPWELEGRSLSDFLDREFHGSRDFGGDAAELAGIREIMFRRRDGTRLVTRVSATPLNPGGPSVGVLTDITPLRKTETDLRTARRFSEQVINSITDSLIVVDPETYRIVNANDRFLAQTTVNPSVVLQKTCYELLENRESPCEVAGLHCPVRETARTQRQVTVERQVTEQDRKHRLLQTVTRPLLDNRGRVTLVIHQRLDVTERQQIQKALKERTKELEKAHEDLATLFEITRQISNSRSLSELVAGIVQTSATLFPSAELLLFLLSPDRTHFLPLEGCEAQVSLPLRFATQLLEQNELLGAFLSRLQELAPTPNAHTSGPCPLVPEVQPLAERHASCTGFPLFVNRECIGYFLAGSPNPQGCTPANGRFLHELFSQVAGTIRRLVVHEAELARLREEVAEHSPPGALIGQSHKMLKIYQRIQMVSGSDATVLITGENGTGKELVARAIHERSHRSDGPFVVANCSAYSSNLLESELFGHERGAFTGAIKARKGRIERAQGGTLFLDEIGDVDPATQILLLRFLQDHRFERVGGEQMREGNVRVVAATNQDLKQAMEAGRFREDLYYRLEVVAIHLPPLRERRNDIPFLSKHFLQKFSTREGKELEGFSPSATQALLDFDWPGNVRQLENAINHAVILAQDPRIHRHDLPSYLRATTGSLQSTSLADVERQLIQRILLESNGNKHEAARRLHLSRSTLYSKLHRYGLAALPGVRNRDAGVGF
ncbi:MAG TPA: sigma-54-dependent Fis family transcriptional regulator [Deferrisomatales bacterium]|nr:sigma-54-dependent Fis family transcriptional regulator [Deferrisomatales bacterium]